MKIKEWQHEIHALAVEKGWWDDDRNFGELIALMHSELSEALEAWRNDEELEWTSPGGKPEGVAVELADCVIRILDVAEHLGVDLGEIMARKFSYNETRPYRHGGKKA